MYKTLLNQHHCKDLEYLEDLKKFFEDIINSHAKFWEIKKEIYINKKNNILNKIKNIELNILTLTDVNFKMDLKNPIEFLIDNKKYHIKNFNNLEEIKKKK